ncbi:hypothetical protein [Streptomyces sp. NBC_01451]|uniref:hypothetical protein n=1 Tax=Streptomyces sp. NBC_01451 TaxID=2903872 RepID=UPI002E2EF3EF|nr:hypothetical protein [Streptomyces sp. NBC_01451]
MDAPVKFVQIIDFETERIDEMRELDVDAFRAQRPGFVARRNSELALARRCPGSLPVSESLPHSDKEVVVLRDDLIKSMQDLLEHTCPFGKKVRRVYFIDEVLRDANYEMQTTINPTAIKAIWEEDVRLLTSNGLHAIDEHTAHLPAASLTSFSQLKWHRHQLR